MASFLRKACSCVGANGCNSKKGAVSRSSSFLLDLFRQITAATIIMTINTHPQMIPANALFVIVGSVIRKVNML